MRIFAWILWSFLLILLVWNLILFVSAFLAYASGKKVIVKVNIHALVAEASMFIFLNLYLFLN